MFNRIARRIIPAMCTAEVFDTRDGSTILFTRAFIARRIVRNTMQPWDYEAS